MTEQSIAMNARRKLRIERIESFSGAARLYEVYLDDEFVDELETGGVSELSVTPGDYTVQVSLKCDLTESQPLKLDISAGETVDLVCGPRCKGGYSPVSILCDFPSRRLPFSASKITTDILVTFKDRGSPFPGVVHRIQRFRRGVSRR